ncbi:cytoskeletal protein CcmA (bactofilin family) [Melaminivora alkalimesophila]|uniref:Cytoskeletal protein CcmA (Bactofilin family) n=2 Tax=Melaminivora alkalimesophila TaxID=1165852 RepID=A0A317R8F2_9BURK|nr:polymer-forming cytoskeletal protein [Melaminivora alkalimesophila]PWW43721.1 cytoskeletal protein CcmA (bactofilin family) [Melaminivora alkalimesophila]
MAVQNPFFGRRDSSAPTNHPATPSSLRSGDGPAARQSASSVLGGGAGSLAARHSEPAAPAAAAAAPAESTTPSGGSKLTVGPNIKLKGVEITDCDTLVVEGTVEATMDSRVIHIAEQGAFKGCAEIDIAEIHGQFDGQLTVREKLVIFGSGRVSGKIRYGKVVIEEGGQLTGEISVGTGSGSGSGPARAPQGAAEAEPARRPAAAQELATA